MSELLNTLARLDAEATPGKWYSVRDGLGIQMGEIGGFALHDDQGPSPAENMRLFVALRNNLPAILEALALKEAKNEWHNESQAYTEPEDRLMTWMDERAAEILRAAREAK